VSARVKVRSKEALARFLIHPAGKVCLSLMVVVLTLGVMVFTYYYVHFARMIDEKLASGPFSNTSLVFAAPQKVMLDDETSVTEIVAQLRRSGYGETRDNRMGWYHVRPDAVEIFPGPDSYFGQEAGVIKFAGDHVSQIISLRDNTERTQYLLEPELITNLFDRNREKRRLVRFADIPKVLVDAVVSAEDKRFFQHSGFDPLRVLKAAYVDVKEGRISEGASTLSMQLAGSVWLDRSKRTWKRKTAEVLITLHLERKLTKQQIFEYYANQIYLGRLGSFNIHGFGEGAQAYFGKDIRQLTLPEAALLAGIIQRPSRFNPLRNPDRARVRRNLVLSMMLENGYITEREYAVAAQSPLGVKPGSAESTDAPYFVDLVNDQLQQQFQDYDFQTSSFRVYTTLDLNLQREAVEAIRAGLKEVDESLHRLGRTAAKGWPPVQVALVALDPHTGAVKALVGGRDYGASQLNRALAKRQPGSVFKPFVYAAALNTPIDGGPRILTTLSTVVDEPTTFWYDEKPYEPSNYKNEFHGVVTLRQALSKSMNIPTVKVAELVGFDKVVELARQAGLNLNIQATPAVALGAYEVTPLEIAGAYTTFANQGQALKPNWIQMIRDQNSRSVYEFRPQPRPVLDPRVAYLMVDLLQEVLRTGTGAGVRSRGFTLPAAGKTGTSHDGWFAGFTSNLLCVVWVGYDDNRELKLEGARSALPIWTEFMKRAHQYRAYRNVEPFEAPDGIVTVQIDGATGKLAAPGCAGPPRTEVFIAGTQPVELCNGARTQVAGWDLPSPEAPMIASSGHPPEPKEATHPVAAVTPDPELAPANHQEKPKQKKGFFRRLLDVFK
jgi:penicillin-binding protein 1B